MLLIAFAGLNSIVLTGAGIRHSIRLPCEMVRDLIYVRAFINGSGPLWLDLDTGASHSVVNPEVADALGLRQSGGGEASGIGRGQSTGFGRVLGATIKVGDSVLRNQELLTLSLKFLAAQIGHATDGSIGSNLFANYVVRTDYARGEVELEDPESWKPDQGSVSIPVELRANMPYIKASLTLPNGTDVSGTFLVDSGMIGAAASINRWFQQTHPDLLNTHVMEMPAVVVVGGSFHYGITRLPALRIGQFTLEGPIVVLPEYASGAEADPTSMGLIGADALSHFTVTFDYPHRRMFLTPNARFTVPFETDMSGLRLITNAPHFNQFQVNGVIPGSPASQAGIRDGDIIAAVDGHPASTLTLEGIQNSFQRPGEVRHLVVKRGPQELHVNLNLRRLM